MGRNVNITVMWILFAVALVALNGFFVAAEFALVKVRPTRLKQMVREKGSLDEVLGMVHTRDLIGIDPDSDFDIRTVARPPRYIPETVHLSRLLSHFQATQQHAALVADEFGTVAGMVTLENVLEEIVGPVRDEFDLETPDIVPDGGRRWILHGRTPVPKLADLLGADLPDEGVDTVAGLVALRLGRIPIQGDTLDLGNATLEVLEASHNRATRVRLEKRPENSEA